ncbi:MAG: ParB N-terminal domain-containing protein [Oscillospiraceae bacterium]|nr:ParB N-terminal domain-containing protein [Oscillospiraceae bacterium]
MSTNLDLGSYIEDGEGEDLLPTARVSNDPFTPKVEKINIPHTPEELERYRQSEINMIKKNAKNFTEGVDIFKNFQRVDIFKLMPCAGNWAYFNPPNDAQFVSLTNSIEQLGVLQPIILLHNNDEDEMYEILVGHSRYLALKALYTHSHDDKFRFIPAYILSRQEVGEYFIRSMILDSNFSYRDIDQTVLIRALIERYTLIKKSKNYRSESNVAEALANEFLMSRSTVFNYLCLQKLCEEVMVLLLEKRIKLQSARYLSRVNHKTQRMILEKYGIDQINIIHRVKFLTNTSCETEEQMQKKIDIANTLVPFTTNLTITINKDLLGDYMKLNADFNVNAMRNYESKFQRNNSDYYFKVRYSNEDMKCYLEKDYVDAKTLGRVRAKNFAELKNYK